MWPMGLLFHVCIFFIYFVYWYIHLFISTGMCIVMLKNVIRPFVLYAGNFI